MAIKKLLLVLTLFVLLAAPVHAACVDLSQVQSYTVTQDTTLCPGTYYMPSGTGAGAIRLAANDVTLDCDGSTIYGANSTESYGIFIDDSNNTTVKGCTVRYFDSGIYSFNSDHSLISNNTVTLNHNLGISLSTTNNTTVSGNTVTGNWYAGIRTNMSVFNTISGNIINDHSYQGDYGMIVGYASYYNTISSNSMDNNYISIILIQNTNIGHSNHNTVTGNTITNSGKDGVRLSGVRFTDVDSNTITGSGEDGIYISGRGQNVVRNNQIHNNGDNGVHLIWVSHQNITGNNITGQTGAGDSAIRLDKYQENGTSYPNNVSLNYLDDNQYGIYINGLDSNPIYNNTIVNTISDGILITNTSLNNSLVNNVITNATTSINDLTNGGQGTVVEYRNEHGIMSWSDSGSSLDVSADISLETGITITENSLTLNSTAIPGLDRAATLTIHNTDQYNYEARSPFKDNVYCSQALGCNVLADADDFVFTVTGFTTYSVKDSPPVPVGGLNSSSAGSSWIYWSWTNPNSQNFDHVEVYLDDVFQTNTSGSVYNATGLQNDDWQYTIKVITVDIYDLTGEPVNDTTKTTAVEGNHTTVGNASSINTTIDDLGLNVTDANGDPVAPGENVTGVNTVSLTSNNTTVVEFGYNYTQNNLHLNEITIEKQNDTAETAYFIVKGLELQAGLTKSIRLDKIQGGNSVCVKDTDVASIGEITDNCDGENEFLLTCDGNNNNGYTCTDNNDYYLITGLTHSAAIEGFTQAEEEEEPYRGGGGGGSSPRSSYITKKEEPAIEEEAPAEEAPVEELPVIELETPEEESELELPTGMTGFVSLVGANIETVSAVAVILILICVVAYAERDKIKKIVGTGSGKPTATGIGSQPPGTAPYQQLKPIQPASVDPETQKLIEMNGKSDHSEWKPQPAEQPTHGPVPFKQLSNPERDLEAETKKLLDESESWTAGFKDESGD
tara:strand:- start:1034 stop:3904 length:2871 start_codon:yes stop_codon:yes gene_type:complete